MNTVDMKDYKAVVAYLRMEGRAQGMTKLKAYRIASEMTNEEIARFLAERAR